MVQLRKRSEPPSCTFNGNLGFFFSPFFALEFVIRLLPTRAHTSTLMDVHTHGGDKWSTKSPVLSAARTIDTCLTKDESFPDLEQLMYHSSASGDYRPLEASNIRKQHTILLPPSLLEQLAGM